MGEYQHLELVNTFLIESKVEFIYTCTLMCIVMYGGCITYVLCYQDGTTPLHIACQEGHLPVVQQLIEERADINCPDEVGYSSIPQNVHAL